MKKLILAAAFAFGATAASADPIEGLWQTEPDEGSFAFVQISKCGGGFCGKITRTFKGTEEYKSENIGLQIVTDMKPAGNSTYKGKVFRPSNGKTYNGTATISGNKMKLEGCIVRPLCADSTWTKLK